MRLADVKRLTERSIRSAGPRYTPGQNPNFPNLSIAEIDDAFIGIIGGKLFSEHVLKLKAEISANYDKSRRELAAAFPRRFRRPSATIDALAQLAECRLGAGLSVIQRARRAVSRHLQTLQSFENELFEAQTERRRQLDSERSSGSTDSHYQDDDTVRKNDVQRRALTNYTSTIDNVCDFLSSRCCEAQHNNITLIVGGWGTGKTHFLCDVARGRLMQGRPALLLLAKDFEPHPTVSDGLIGYAAIARDITSLVNGLGRLARKGERALLIIDGINESDSEAWKEGVDELIRCVRRRDDVALVLSSRSPMHLGIFRPSTRRRLVELLHPGFSDIEFDAQQSFFDFYEIPLPEVPLLADEFSRPLALKILCEAFKDLPDRTQRAGFAGLSSGQRGMTRILERFINSRARETEALLGLPRGFCWRVMKGDNRVQDPLLSGIAPNMAANRVNYVPKDEVLNIIGARSAISSGQSAGVFYRRILAEGLLIESDLWRPDEEGGPLTVVRMPYERFGDHIVARHILGKYLDVTNEATIRQSLYRNRPLGAIFTLDGPYHYRYELDGWAEALIIEFPERVKRTLSEDATELFFYLPKARQSISAYWEPFCSGLFWRHPGSFSKQTDQLAGAILWSGHDTSARRMIDALLAVATKPKHPYGGARLYKNFENMDLPSRDLLWSEYLRTRYRTSSADRLVKWFERPIGDSLGEAGARNLIAVFSLFLTSTDRQLRDRVTKVLVRLGELFPKELFEHTLLTMTFNDPYVPERMLAASYGVGMSLWADRSNRVVRRELPEFARQLVRRIYLPSGDFRTPHILIREYSLGLIELARLVQPNCIATQWIRRTRPPFDGQHDPFPSGEIDDAVSEKAKSAVLLDFGNYTIGRLIADRQNYDYSNPEYVQVRKNIDWRICDLGYEESRFDLIDQSIGRSAWNSRRDANKVDRYGKKYSWIAYFEMYGVRQAHGLLPDNRQDERISDCDIDPSFPKRPAESAPPPNYFFRRITESHLDWLKNGTSPRFLSWLRRDRIDEKEGPWVLLDGFVSDVQPSDKRSAFAFLRGYLTDPENIDAFKEELDGVDHPGSGLPDPGEHHCTFAGEIPWSRRFAAAARPIARGRTKEYSPVEAFPSSRKTYKRKRVKKAWRLVYEKLGTIPDVGAVRFVSTKDDEENDELKIIDDAISEANAAVSRREQIEFADLVNRKPTVEELEAGYWTVEEWEFVPGIPLHTASWRYSWGSDHSAVNDFSGFRYPAPLICDQLGLTARNRSIDLFDQTGAQATLYRGAEDSWSKTYDVLYLRKDLLDKVLRAKAKSLVWVVWGERGFPTEDALRLNHEPDIQVALQHYEHLYKRVSVYTPA